MLGIVLGFPVMLLTVGIGLGGVFVEFPALHAALKYLCIAYLLYLALRIATASALLRQFLHTQARRRLFNYSMAALLIASIIPVFWETA